MIKPCNKIKMQEYEHGVYLEFFNGNTAGVDKCLVNEVYKLNNEHGVVTVGCCCGHDKVNAYIQVMPEYVKSMIDLGYEQLPLDKHGNGKWCFKPKTILKYEKE